MKNIYIHSEMFSILNGLLTPTLKAKRPELKEFFKEKIDQLYDSISMWRPADLLFVRLRWDKDATPEALPAPGNASQTLSRYGRFKTPGSKQIKGIKWNTTHILMCVCFCMYAFSVHMFKRKWLSLFVGIDTMFHDAAWRTNQGTGVSVSTPLTSLTRCISLYLLVWFVQFKATVGNF